MPSSVQLATQANTCTRILQEDNPGLSAIVLSTVSSNQIQPDGGEHQFPLEKIARIVRGKDLSSLVEFGGVQAIAVAFNTYLVDGIPGDTEDINCRSIYNTPHNMEPPREKTFWSVLWDSWQTYTYILLCYFGWFAFVFGRCKAWMGETMNILVQNSPKEKNFLEAQLEKLISSAKVTTLIYMLILVVLFACYMSERKDYNGVNVDLGGKPITVMEFIQAIERITIKPRGKISILMVSVTVLLVGMQEELAFLMALCVSYWKRKILSSGFKSTVQKSTICLSYHTAGVNVRIISQDDISVVRAEATEFGILTENSEAAMLKGDFRNFSAEERIGKYIGFCEGRLGHKNGKRLLTPHVMEWNLEPVPNIIKCDQCAYENIQKFIKLELTVILSGLSTTTILTISSGKALVTSVQLSWTYLIVSILSGMAAITEPPGEKLINKPPVQKTEPLITEAMRRNIIAQVTYQVVIFVIVRFKGHVLYGTDQKLRKAMMFNSIALLHVFNQFNSREIEKLNVFKNIDQNYWFRVATSGPLALQIAFVEISGIIKGKARLDYEKWGIRIAFGIFSWVGLIAWSSALSRLNMDFCR
ncbi:hypothetical protein SADUNF_Sadunf16G0013600 [Salix dunnii]|uniref:Cation-transporting P-type ATPase C-terminal domain-containing protein n=1 Tax=Salix dunnii TaxID=1413687 RepID=A0A835JBS1_9ROSI|nr:hypothetical protein SADUNF_Sadunf16G0013600 [Salix dunnii]